MALNFGIRGLNPRLATRSTMLMDGIPVPFAPYGQPQLSFAPVSMGNMDAVGGVGVGAGQNDRRCACNVGGQTSSSQLLHSFLGRAYMAQNRPADVAAVQLLNVIDQLTPADSGHFFAYDGERLPW